MQLFDVPRSALKVTFEDVPTPGRLQHMYLPALQILEVNDEDDDAVERLRDPSLDKWWVLGNTNTNTNTNTIAHRHRHALRTRPTSTSPYFALSFIQPHSIPPRAATAFTSSPATAPSPSGGTSASICS